MSEARITPTNVKAPIGGDRVTISWADGFEAELTNELLRGYCPCAHCQGHGGAIRFVDGHNTEILGIDQVGNYALQFTWGDQHGSGIYSFRFLRALCEGERPDGEAGHR